MKRLALIGYGKMGRMIDGLAHDYGFETVLRVDEHNREEAFAKDRFTGIDVAVEFTTPEAAISNIQHCANLGVNCVIGTTGWTDDLESARELVESSGIGLVWSPNFSVGMNVFFRLISEAATLLKDQYDYEAWAYEIHHSQKKDAPSGTLLKLVEEMKEAGYTANIDVASNRAGKVPGTHEIGFDSAADSITLRHTARSREGFARGALQAAQWVMGKKGFFNFSDILFKQEA